MCLTELRLQYLHTCARCMQWREEVLLLTEEMQRYKEFMVWHADWWWKRAEQRKEVSEDLWEGLEAYAEGQAMLHESLQSRAEYCSFPTTSLSPVPWTNELNLKQGDSPLHSEAVNWTAGQTQMTYTLPNYCIILIKWSAHVTCYRWCSLTKVIILAPWLLHLPKTARSAAENGNKRPFWHCNGVQKPSVTRYTYQIRSVQTCLLHVTEHLIEMIQ